MAVHVRVPGKINLALRVGARRKDGYHELATVFQAVSVYDDVTVSDDDEFSCEVRGAQSHRVGVGDDNLAVRAAKLLADEYGVERSVRIVIDKRIPVAGGMAGGSGDAAAALLACSTLWGLGLSVDDLMTVGSLLGADVPFPLMGGCALGRNRGDQLVPVLSRGRYSWVFACAHEGLSTPRVFRQFDDQSLRAAPDQSSAPPQIPTELIAALASGNPYTLAQHLRNDLHDAACVLMPSLKETIRAGRDAGCLGFIVSGSGPTIGFLTENDADATSLAVHLSSLGVAREVRVAHGPVAGATIVVDD